jgi:hypothetical protein
MSLKVRGEIHELALIPRVFPLHTEDPLNGIIYELTREQGGSIRNKGIVQMRPESEEESDVENLLDVWSDSEYCSKDERGQWVCWEFQESFIRPTHYTVRSSNDNYLKSWLVEGSMNGPKWTELDQRKNDTHLKGAFAVHSFDVESPVECRFLRLTQTGKNHSDEDHLGLSAFEILGSRRPAVTGWVLRPLTEDGSLDGIIAYLTREHIGNIHEMGIIAITTADGGRAQARMADLDRSGYTYSKNDPGQWICWDFREIRIRPTHYTIVSENLVSWTLEASMDGATWKEIDRHTDREVHGQDPASFAVSDPVECRFILLTQTAVNYEGTFVFEYRPIEFFGSLLEWPS